MNEKIHSLLLAVAVFFLSFAVSFLIFGGVSKISRYFQAKKVEQENQVFYAKQKKMEQEKKQKKQEEQKLLESVPELGTVSSSSSETQKNEESVSSQVSEVSKVTSNQSSSASVQAPTNEDLVNDLAKRFKGVLDLSTNQEWLSYPVEIRKAAFEKMNPPQTSSVSSQAQTPETASSQPTTKAVELSSVDKMFLGEDVLITQYTVVPHDSWLKIAEKLSVSTDDLLKWNPTIKKLKVGDVLQIKKSSNK